MFLYYREVNPNVAVNGNVKFVDISERHSKRVKYKAKQFQIKMFTSLLAITFSGIQINFYLPGMQSDITSFC